MIARAVLSQLGPAVVGCLVEGSEGEVLAHALPDRELPDPVVRAVLLGSVDVMDAALADRRTLGLTATGPALHGALAFLVVVRLALPDRGGLWLLVDGPLPPLDELEQAARSVELPAVPSRLLRCLEGQADAVLPALLRDCAQWWVAATSGPAPRPSGGLVVQSCSDGAVTYLVVGGGTGSPTARVRSLLAGRRAGLSRARRTQDLVSARQEADLAMELAGPGEVVCAEQSRSALVVRHVTKALSSLPDLGEDPLARLVAYDDRRDGRLVETLHCWLTSRTEALGVHGNTLRYRLRRIEQITGVDLRRDATGRLELQLRLAAQPQLSRRRSSTAS